MSDKSHIEWTEATWNPVTGCTLVSEGCRNCYAARLAATRLQHHPSRKGLARVTADGVAKWTGEVRFNDGWLDQPLKWKRSRMIFVCAHSDLFHPAVPDHWIDKVFAVMALAPQHTYQLLTKRPERARDYVAGVVMDGDQNEDRWTSAVNCVLTQSGLTWGRCGSTATSITTRSGEGAVEHGMLRVIDGRLARWIGGTWFPVSNKFMNAVFERDGREHFENDFAWGLKEWPLPNVWLGTSVEDQARADERIPALLDTPAALRFVSAEPLLGPVDLRPYLKPRQRLARLDDVCVAQNGMVSDGEILDWVIVGGESGPGARPMHPDWARSLRDQCEAAGVLFFFKQWGAWVSRPRRDPCIGFTTIGDQAFERVGKAKAGRLLDGREHNGMPEMGGASTARSAEPATAGRPVGPDPRPDGRGRQK